MGFYLLKIGELSLKKGNKKQFEDILARNLTRALKGSGASFVIRDGRFFVRAKDEARDFVEAALGSLAGITGWAAAREAEKTIEAVLAASVEEAKAALEHGAKSFKVEARRSDKSFPLNSYGINCAAGDAISAAFPDLKVDVKKPDFTIKVEVREKAFIYGSERRGLRGLPVGTAGRGLLLLSGGIDSPVAGFLMSLRGLSVYALHFDAYPYTTADSKQKVIELSAVLRKTALNLKLFIINLAEIEKRIKERAPEAWAVVLLRMVMMECASRLARKKRCKCIITGESLSQVASQTVENITCSQSKAELPVFRPLIGMDKEDITAKAIEIGTYYISIRPASDCCALFSPTHPIIHAKLEEAVSIYESLEIEELLQSALEDMQLENMQATA